MTSLPVPLSPLMNTEASVAATLRARSTALRKSGRDADQGDLVAVPDLLHQLHPEILRFARHHHRVGRAPDQHLQMGGRERLGQVVPGAGPERLDAAGDAGVSRHDHDDRVLVGLQRGLQDLEPGDLGHVQVDEDDIELAAPDRLQRLLAPADQRHIVAIHLQHAGAALPQRALVVDDEHPNAGFDFTGNGERIACGALGDGRGLPLRLGEGIGHPANSRGRPRVRSV